MTHCFPSSKRIQMIFTAAGVLFAVAAFWLWRDEILLVRIIYAAIGLGLLVALGQLAATRHASAQHQRLLGLLYRDADPESFLRAYASLPERCKPGSAEQVMTACYLAGGHMARGDFAAAVSLLEKQSPEELKFHKMGLVALLHTNLCQCRLWTEDAERAAQALERLRGLRDELSTRMPAVSQNLGHSIRLYEEHLKLLQGGEPDLEYLREEVALSANPVHKANMKLLLARALPPSQGEEARALLQELTALRHDLFARREAGRLLAEGI